MKRLGFAFLGLALLLSSAALAMAGQSLTPAVSEAVLNQTAAQAGSGMQLCRAKMPPCVLKCRAVILRKRCNPGSICRFKHHSKCKCYFRDKRCYLKCISKLVTVRCNKKGYCAARVRICRCYRR